MTVDLTMLLLVRKKQPHHGSGSIIKVKSERLHHDSGSHCPSISGLGQSSSIVIVDLIILQSLG